MKILFVTLSNIGDSILTLPVLDAIKENYPQAKVTCLVPQRPKELFVDNPFVDKVVIFDKHSKLKDKIKLFFDLSRQDFDMVIDLRNSFFGAFLPAKKRSSPFRVFPKDAIHMKDRHLFWAGLPEAKSRDSLNISSKDSAYVENFLKENKVTGKLIAVSPGARSHTKCWSKESFIALCKKLTEENFSVVLVGDKKDEAVCSSIKESCAKAIDFCGKTNLFQLAALLKNADLLVTNDSAVMHLASYLDTPVVSIFGPTDEKKYGPWSGLSKAVKKPLHCRPCLRAQCRFGTLACLFSVKPEEVFGQIKKILSGEEESSEEEAYRRILIARTDRIGDVVLSTPVIRAIRKKFPNAFISMLVAPEAKDIVESNPYLDEVIIYDKKNKHRSWARTLKFAAGLKNKKFDLVVILHPSNRIHLISFLAGIPKRIGYNRKLGFLVNLKKEHKKQEGNKHEAEYNFDLLWQDLGIAGDFKNLFMPISQESEQYINKLLEKEGVLATDKILAINPGASCPSKIWPVENFGRVAEEMAKNYGFKIMIVGGTKEIPIAEKIAGQINVKAINLAGKTSVGQLASALKRADLFISNDSGPVHIASAVGTPVISIFGRSQPGLSPKRWGPLGKHDRYLHKNTGCIECLAHNCRKEFACLKAITVEDVLLAAESVLKNK